MLGLFGADRINVLIDGVGCSHIPVVTYPFHRRQDLDELADFTAENVPSLADMPVERERLVLGEDVDAVQTGVQTVGKRNIDDAIDAAEGYSRFRAIAGQRIKTFARASGEQDS